MEFRRGSLLLVALVALACVSLSSGQCVKDCPPLYGLCSQGMCNNSAGIFGKYVVPPHNCSKTYPTSPSKPFCAGASVKPITCCNKCANLTAGSLGTAFSCAFWMHIATGPGGSCSDSLCGKCILFPSGTIPSCNGTLQCARIGKACPFTKNDPHFLGAHGTRFEFNGSPDKSFCLLTEKDVQVNMKMHGYYDKRTVGASVLVNGMAVRTWIRELAVIWRAVTGGEEHKLLMVARKGKDQEREDGFVDRIELDGQVIPKMQVGETKNLAGGLAITFTGYAKSGPFDVDEYNINVEGRISLNVRARIAHPLLQTDEDAETHLNVQFQGVTPTETIHGVMGQTYRSGRGQRALDYSALAQLLHHPVAADGVTGKGFLDGEPSDYETSSVLAPDCKYTTYQGKPLPEEKEYAGVEYLVKDLVEV
ncbi:unnamed protein product [Closterium sp. NIES-64]|nr:unnamed protein product [Closterium sp. NIES-64]